MGHKSLTVGSLSILLWNTNGLLKNKTELDMYLHEKRTDVALITETHLTPRNKINIPDYTIYRTDHPDNTSHGGTAVIIRSSLKHHPIHLPKLPDIQATAITLYTSQHPITLAAVYCPPRYSLTPTMFCSFFEKLGRCFIAGGDYNAKHQLWGSRLCSPRGRSLQAALQNLTLNTISPNTPTYWPTSRLKTPDLLDFFITKGLQAIPYTVRSSFDLCSDHSLVHLILLEEPCQKEERPTLTRGNMNWDCYQAHLNKMFSVPLSLKTENEIEEAVEVLTKSIQESARCSSTPRRQKTNTYPCYPQFVL